MSYIILKPDALWSSTRSIIGQGRCCFLVYCFFGKGCFFQLCMLLEGGEGNGSLAPGGWRFIARLPGMTTCLQRQVVFFLFLLWYLVLVRRGFFVLDLFYIETFGNVMINGYVVVYFFPDTWICMLLTPYTGWAL